MTTTLDFFYFLGSTYTHLTVMRIERIAAAAGRAGALATVRPARQS